MNVCFRKRKVLPNRKRDLQQVCACLAALGAGRSQEHARGVQVTQATTASVCMGASPSINVTGDVIDRYIAIVLL